MKKNIIIVIILAVIIVILVLFLLLPKPVQSPSQNNSQILPGIQVLSPKPNDVISSPLKITGYVNGNGWIGFEGQVGTVHLLDKDGKELSVIYLPATTEWTALPTNFEANLEFTAPPGTPGSVVLKNENASGDPERDKTFTIPIKFK